MAPAVDPVDALGDAVVVLDADTAAVREVNDAAASLFGHDPETLRREGIELLADGAGAAEAFTRRARRAVEEDEERFDWPARTAEGGRLVLDTRLTAATLDGHECVVAVLRDVTDRVAAEEELATYRRRLEGVMLAGTVAWWEMDVETGATQFHPNKVDVLGYDAAGFDHYSDFTDLLHPDDYDPAMEAMRAHLEGRADRYEVEYRIRDADGEYRWFRDIGHVTQRSSDGAPERVTGLVLDVTERREAQERLERQNTQLETLNRLVRHDIRNDMTVAIGWLDYLSDAVDAEHVEYVDRALRASEHTVALTHSIRDLMELIAEGEDALSVEPVALDEVVVGELERVRELYPDATVTAPDGIPAVGVEANPLLSSVVGNVLDNAVEHNDCDDPQVTVTVEESEQTVTLRIADDGPGIPDERKETVFAETAEDGAGHGLALVQMLVSAYGGKVWVEDSEPTGAVFCIQLKRARSA